MRARFELPREAAQAAKASGSVPSGGAATPGGDPGQLQYHGADGALAGVPGSSVTSTQVYLPLSDGTSDCNLSIYQQSASLVANGGLADEMAHITVEGTPGTSLARVSANNTDETAFGTVTVEPSKIDCTGSAGSDNFQIVGHVPSPGAANVILNAGDGVSDSEVSVLPASITLSSLAVLIPGLPVYADNAAALAGGLVVNQLYRTTAGDLKIVEEPT